MVLFILAASKLEDIIVKCSVAEPGAGAALFKVAPVAYFRQARKKSLVLVSNMTLRAV